MKLKCGSLGIKGTEMYADIAKAFNLDVQRGAFVSVLPGLARRSGSLQAGDIITSLNGKPLSSFAELRSHRRPPKPGTKPAGLLRKPAHHGSRSDADTSTSSSASAELI